MADPLEAGIMPRVAVAGLGKTGVSCVNFLLGNGARVLAVDTRENPPGLAHLPNRHSLLEVRLGAFDENLFLSQDQVIVSPGLALSETALVTAAQAGIEVIGDIELFARYANAPVVGITGSNGKSTVTCLVRDMLKNAGLSVVAGGNLGEPALDLLSNPPPDYYVLELSSFQLESLQQLSLAVAVNLNVSADHMDRYHSLQSYAMVKQRIYRHADYKIFNQDDKWVVGTNDLGEHWVGFTLGVPEPYRFGVRDEGDEVYLAYGDTRLMKRSELSLLGEHNVANALAVFALGHVLAIDHAVIAQTLKTFSGLPHRMQLVSEHGGVKWINDSKGTNVGATLAALNGLSGSVILIAGGDAKGADFLPLCEVVKNKVKVLLSLGQDAAALEAVLGKVVPYHRMASIDEAVVMAKQMAAYDDTVLLSPACASTDMFASYQERGCAFVESVKQVLGL